MKKLVLLTLLLSASMLQAENHFVNMNAATAWCTQLGGVGSYLDGSWTCSDSITDAGAHYCSDQGGSWQKTQPTGSPTNGGCCMSCMIL